MTAKAVKQVLHNAGVTVRYAKKSDANYIVIFHAVRPAESLRFEATIRFLSQNFQIVRMDDLISQMQNGTQAQQGRLMVITFDDGLKNHAEVAYPILKKLGVPATFYLCPELIDVAYSVWTWEVHSRLGRLTEKARQRFFDVAGVSGEVQGIVEWMKTIPLERRERVEKEIHDCTPDFQFTPKERDCYGLMSWEQIQSLDSALITIGSHTATHVDLPQAQRERLERELSNKSWSSA